MIFEFFQVTKYINLKLSWDKTPKAENEVIPFKFIGL